MNNDIEKYIESQEEWKQARLIAFRDLVHEVAPDVEEQWKWMVPVFVVNQKLVCAMSTFKDHVKFNFFEGAILDDTHHVLNSGLDSKKHRSINVSRQDTFNDVAIRQLLEQAVDHVRQ